MPVVNVIKRRAQRKVQACGVATDADKAKYMVNSGG